MNLRGFTLFEVLISIAIILIISGMGTYVFVSSRNSTNLNASADGIFSTLEQARADALSGKNGSNYGVNFSTSTYTSFAGSSYSSGNSTNILRKANGGTTISSAIGGSGATIIFSRLTGLPSATGTVTVLQSATSKTKVITIGSQGNVTVQ